MLVERLDKLETEVQELRQFKNAATRVRLTPESQYTMFSHNGGELAWDLNKDPQISWDRGPMRALTDEEWNAAVLPAYHSFMYHPSVRDGSLEHFREDIQNYFAENDFFNITTFDRSNNASPLLLREFVKQVQEEILPLYHDHKKLEIYYHGMNNWKHVRKMKALQINA